MIVSEKHNFLYIAVAKTGTSLLESHLTEHINKDDCITINRPADVANGGLHKHSRHIDIVNAIPACKAYWKFAFVRNPYDRVVSWFSYLTQGRNGKAVKKKHLAAYGSRYLSGDFKDFIMHCPPWIFNNHFFFLCDEKEKIAVDFIGRYENLAHDLNTVCDTIAIPRPHNPSYINRSKHKHYSEYYDDETRNIVAEKYKKDITYFGYEFRLLR